MLNKLNIGVITVSTRAFNKVYDDQGGPSIEKWLNDTVKNPIQFYSQIVPDNKDTIKNTLIHLCDQKKCPLILSTGGTGPAPSDVTPDATRDIADKILDGFGEQMRQISLKYVPTAILSRQIGAIRKSSLIINLPGQPKAIAETLDELFVSIPYCVELISQFIIVLNESKMKAFRPKSAPKLNL